MEKRGPGARVTIEERARCFKLFGQGLSITDIARETGFHKNTIKKFKKVDEWQERLDRIYSKVIEGVSLDLAVSITDTLRMVQTFKHKFAIRLNTISPSAIPVTMMGQLKELFDMEQELMGSLQSYDGEDLSLYSDEQLEGMLRESCD